MFLSLGGSRRRAQGQGNAQLQGTSSTSALLLQDLKNPAGLVSLGGQAEGPLQALATGKYAASARASVTLPPCDPTSGLIRSKSFGEDSSAFAVSVSAAGGCCHSAPEPVQTVSSLCSPNSTLSYNYLPSLSRETSRVSSDSGVSLLNGGGEEAISRDCTQLGTSRRSQTLDLAKKLKNSLGSKFADSLRKTIKEVVMNQEGNKYDGSGNNAWPALVQSLEDSASGEVSQSEAAGGTPWDDCWSVEKNNDIVTPPDHSSLLPFEGLTTVDGYPGERSEKRSFGGSGEHSKRLSWFSQVNSSQSAIPELSWGTIRPAQVVVSTPSSSIMDNTEFFTHSDMSLCAVLKESGAKESWTNHRSGIMSRLPTSSRPAVTRNRHVFPEAAAMGTCRPDSLLQQSNPNFQQRGETTGLGRAKPSVGSLYNLIKKADHHSFLDVSKAFQSSASGGKDCESLLEFLNPGHPANRALREDARQRLYAQSAAKDSCESVPGGWHEKAASTSYCNGAAAVLPELLECGGALGIEGEKLGGKRSRDDAAYANCVQLSKRQCSLLDVPALAIDDDHGGVKSDDPIAGGFEEYLANLTASARVPSYELPGSPLAKLLEDFSQDSIVPIHLT